jgi:hypothetical protein
VFERVKGQNDIGNVVIDGDVLCGTDAEVDACWGLMFGEALSSDFDHAGDGIDADQLEVGVRRGKVAKGSSGATSDIDNGRNVGDVDGVGSEAIRGVFAIVVSVPAFHA